MAKNKNKPPKPMKRSVITLADFRSRHYGNMNFATDMYYVGFANRICLLLKKMIGDKDKRFDAKVIKNLALNLTSYLEDLVSQSGIWEAFLSLHNKKYGREMPFYDTDDEFYSRELPCLQAVNFIVWLSMDEGLPDTILNPHNPFMKMMSLAILPVIIDAYDKAPDTPFRPVIVPEEVLGVPVLFQIRAMCKWLCEGCYLTRIIDMDSVCSNLEALANRMLEDADKKSYMYESYIPFNARIGPLAISPQEWLVEIIGLYPEEEEEKYLPIIRELKSRPYSVYKYTNLRKDGAELIAVDGSKLDFSAYSMNDYRIPPEIEEGDSALMSLIYFNGKWMLNSVAVQKLPNEDYEEIHREWLKYSQNVAENYNIVFKSLKKKRIGVAAGYEDYLRTFFPDVDRSLLNDVPEDIKNADNLVFFLESNSNVTLLPDWGACVKIRGNKFYDKKKAEADSMTLIMNHKLTTPEMREYLIENNLVPDAALSSVVSVEAGKRLFQQNIRFLNDYADRNTMSVYSKDVAFADNINYETNA